MIRVNTVQVSRPADLNACREPLTHMPPGRPSRLLASAMGSGTLRSSGLAGPHGSEPVLIEITDNDASIRAFLPCSRDWPGAACWHSVLPP
jgi:hypothetical protein